MNDKFFLKFELICLFVLTNLVAFSLGMLLPLIEFDVPRFLAGLEIYHWATIIIGLVIFGIGLIDFIRRFNRIL